MASVVIVGAGIVGVACAASLAEAGHEVTAVDRSGVCEETSAGNAAALAFTEVLPLAHKGMWKKLPRWLLDPLGPFSIPPSYLPKLLPWLARFVLAGDPRRHDAAVSAQVALMRLAEAEWISLIDRAGLRRHLIENGCLELFDSDASFRAARAGYDLRQRLGIAFRHLARDELAALQPGLSPHFAAGTFAPGWKNVDDPKLFGKAVWTHAERRGARLVLGAARTLRLAAGRPEVEMEDGRIHRADHVVLAAGAWSHRLAATLGERLPLETERGYNTTLPADAFDVRLQLVFADHGFVVTPLSTGLRIGGAVELGGVDRPPNYARSKAMLEKTRRFLPGLKTAGGVEWMGYRPSLPDSLPVIGRAKASPHVLYAFGHGHLGLTQAAATGRLIRDLVSGEAAAIDPAPYRPDRF